MLKKLTKINQALQNRHMPVEYNLEPYRRILERVNHIDLKSLNDNELKAKSLKLKTQVLSGVPLDDLLMEAFALVREASRRVLGLYPFDVQVVAGVALHKGKIAEMQTGEGKTLAAVMPAYLNALTGKGVHVLTFNDYLAYRDAQWMGPVYKFLGLTVGYVKEGMGISQRQDGYFCDITYVTAKESGFDYLRDFLCEDKDQIVHRPFHYAIADEADSILIDEARIPLVIAGSVPQGEDSPLHMANLVKGLVLGQDYELDQNGKNVYLTDSGLLHVEKILGCGNLYDSKNLEFLTRLNCALYAEILLAKDRDYIVRNGKIELIDEFTGRIADKRHWPDNIHAAVEAKEGLISSSKGMIMGSIALQYFMGLYPKISGMTGTAHTAAVEFKEFYGMDVVVIPTNKPCNRIDHPDRIFTHQEAKQNALVKKIQKVHATDQPILIGTGSVEESELLAEELKRVGVECRVLNAKNDEMEAGIIARAGELGAVTVSTNMAGRGIDIKLGGENEEEKAKVVALGGLYVIGTNHYESRRIDNQLRGRAGRQGDPGESRFFVSLQDDLIKKYEITKLISRENFPERSQEPIENSDILDTIARGQRIVEGYNSDVRRQLWKYSYVIEQQRQIIHAKRQSILMDQEPLKLLAAKASERYESLKTRVSGNVLQKVEKQMTLYYINKCWTEYLDYISYIRESIHLMVIGKKNPLDEFHKMAIEAFDELSQRIENEILEKFNAVYINQNGVDIEKEGLKGPSSTWTYLVSDNPEQFSNLPFIIKTAAAAVSKPFNSMKSVFNRFFKK